MTKPTHLYRHFDADDNLLYVGISISAYERFKGHRSNSEWANKAVKMTIQAFNTRSEALAAERLAIINEKPAFNIVHNDKKIAKFNRDPSFVKMHKEPAYIEINAGKITDLFDLPRSMQKVLGYILNKMDGNNEVVIASGLKERMIQELKINPQTLNNSLCQLVKKGLLKTSCKGLYAANPDIFI